MKILIAVPTFENIYPDTFKSIYDLDASVYDASFEFVRGYDCATARNRIAQLSNEYGFDCLKTDDKEYEPYFYCDVMHLGWKGWPYVLQNIIEHFEEQDR